MVVYVVVVHNVAVFFIKFGFSFVCCVISARLLQSLGDCVALV